MPDPTGAILVGLLVLVPTTAQTPAELEVRIERAIELARSAAADPDPARMDAVREALGLPDGFEVGGRTVRIPPDPFLASLAGDTASEFEAAVAHLEALSAAVSGSTGTGPDRAALRRDLVRAMGREGAAEPGVIERFRRFLSSLFQRLADGIRSGFEGGPAWVLLALSLIVVVLAGWRLRLRPVPEAAARERSRPAEWRRLAEEARARGDMAAAVAALYRSIVSRLADRGLVEDRPSLTAGEVRAAIAAEPIASSLGEATRRYERVRYGMAEPTGEDLEAMLTAERAVGAG